MTDSKTPVRRLRSTKVYYMDLKKDESLPLGGLPTNRNVLEVIQFQKSKEKRIPVEFSVSYTSSVRLRLLVNSRVALEIKHKYI